MKPVFVSSNKNKINEFSSLIPSLEFSNFEYPELRSDDPCEISILAAKTLSEKLKRSVIVEDSGLFISALGDFPGTCTKYVTKRIGNRGILALLKGVKKRKCFYKSAIGFCSPGNDPVCFLGVEEGTVSLREKGNKGWGNDPIFIPKGSSKTYGEIKKNGQPAKFRILSVSKLKEFLAARDY